jgi:hypothetical protein
LEESYISTFFIGPAGFSAIVSSNKGVYWSIPASLLRDLTGGSEPNRKTATKVQQGLASWNDRNHLAMLHQT